MTEGTGWLEYSKSSSINDRINMYNKQNETDILTALQNHENKSIFKYFYTHLFFRENKKTYTRSIVHFWTRVCLSLWDFKQRLLLS